ncbi:hypothetical protein EVAR_87038_1 [Eumeta japonica]|uniref:Uncharacterized protein n=1 Tax=Eumeta variegata TaxID=151549 RepID=A0A4C1YZK1_EUMVA|nr:hypothetical protein EVAR_87038_1 [Eumeta japonica]
MKTVRPVPRRALQTVGPNVVISLVTQRPLAALGLRYQGAAPKFQVHNAPARTAGACAYARTSVRRGRAVVRFRMIVKTLQFKIERRGGARNGSSYLRPAVCGPALACL